VPINEDVEPSYIARGTPGFSGADLANLVNEAALFAARQKRRTVEMEQFEQAKDKIMMGSERKSMVMSEKEKRNTAFHEAGHCIVGRLAPHHDPVYKVSIIPRGRALGVTMFLPEEDRYSMSKEMILSQICALFGGRVAEEMTLGENGITTGASNDIQHATKMARSMVTRWGLSTKLGPLMYEEEEEEVFLGMSAGSKRGAVSGDTAKAIDDEVRRIIDDCYGTAKRVLKENCELLHNMAEALLEYETIDRDQIDDVMQGKKARPPQYPDDLDGADGTKPSPKNDEGTQPGGTVGGPAGEH
jgi:cell division protease FtsH